MSDHAAIESGRLALYLAAALAHDPGRITSAELGEYAGVNATQVRRDLSQVVGKVGKRGVGYSTEVLKDTLPREIAGHAAHLAELAKLHWQRSVALDIALDFICEEQKAA